MANSNTGYNLTYFAQEALIALENKLGFAARFHRGYSPSATQKGNTITIPRPSTFTVADAPASASDLSTQGVNITLDQWKEVKFALPDNEQHFTHETIMGDHVRPAVYALANDMDNRLAALYKKIPWAYDYTASTDATKIASILGARKILRDNGAPIDDGMMHLALSSAEEASLMAAEFMYAADKVGGMTPTLMQGSLGTRYGIEFFANTNIDTHTSGTAINGGDVAGAANGAASVGATSVVVDGFTGSETIVEGDSFVFAGHTQRYVSTGTTTFSTGAGTINFYPALKTAVADNEVITFEAGASTLAESFRANLMFHRNAFALATAPLQSNAGSAQARAQGIQVETAVSPESNLALRARMWYDPDLSRNVMAFDVLYGFVTLDPNLAVRLRATG